MTDQVPGARPEVGSAPIMGSWHAAHARARGAAVSRVHDRAFGGPSVRGGAVGLVVALLTGCSAGTSAFESCVGHSVEEGVDRAAAEAACEDVVED